MLKMQLPLKKAEEEGEETAEDEKEQSGLFPELAFTAASGRLLQEPTEEPGAPCLTKESVYEWFGLHLSPAKRIEFMYGLLHMCQPLELRFLGSCLEDLARKDFHVLRDFEIRANSSSDLGLLTDVTDPVARSKLLVCLSLLGSDNRECAGILFRILSHVDPALLLVSSYPGSQAFDAAFPSLSGGDSDEDGTHNCGGFEPFVESRAGLLEQLAVLFTMASLHPAFLFHQRGKLRMQLEKLEQDLLIQRQNRRQCVHHNTHAPPQGQPECHFANSQVNVNEKTQSHNLAPAHHSRRAERDGKAHAVHIEKIVLKGISRGKMEREYSFEVKWSDMSTSSITKTHLEMKNFLFQLPKEHSTDSFERSILQLLSQKHEGREMEQSLKEKFLSAPHAFRQTGKVCGFFHCGSLSSPSLSCSRWKPYKEDCSEASSQEEDMEPYVQEHRKKPGNKSPGLNMRSSEGKSTDHGSDNNNLTEWRKKSCTLKPTCTQYTKPAGGEGENSSTKPKARSATSEGEKRERGVGRVPVVTNGVMSLPSPRPHQPKGKDAAPCQNTYGETSSESYSSPSSPQHDGRESLESEDEKGKDTDSHSDDSRKSIADAVLVCPVTGGLDEGPHSLVQLKHGGQEVQPEGTIQGYPQIHFAHHAPYKMPNGPEVLVTASSPQVPDNKVGTELMMPHSVVLPTQTVAIDDPETCSSETPSAVPSFNTSVLGLQPPGSPVLQPILHRFKTAGAQSGTECGVLVPPPHQTPLGAISVVQSGTTYPPALQVGYANPDQVLSSIIPAESHTKTPGLTLPSALPAAFNLPTATTGIPPMGTVGTASSSPVPAPVVPTHTPGPAPSPIPALTHSIAQSDGGYINSSASNNIPQLPQPQQQLPAARPVLGCNACGCRGSCGSTHVPDYYFHAQMAPRQVFNVPPIFQLTSLCSSSYLSQLNQTPQTNGATQVPFYPTAPSAFAGGTLLHHHSHTHSDHVLGSQAANFGLQQMTAFNRFYQPIYATTMVPGAGSGPGMPLGAVSGGINKKNGTISCYNCGGNGHYAQDCKQPLIDATQQGGFRLKYAPHSETLDNNPD